MSASPWFAAGVVIATLGAAMHLYHKDVRQGQAKITAACVTTLPDTIAEAIMRGLEPE